MFDFIKVRFTQFDHIGINRVKRVFNFVKTWSSVRGAENSRARPAAGGVLLLSDHDSFITYMLAFLF